MGCLGSNTVASTENTNPNHININFNSDDENNYIDTDDFRIGDFPLFQPNFYNKNIKNIKKVYEERTNEGNNTISKIHKIFIIVNYEVKRITSIEIEIEKSGNQILRKHLKKLIYHGCFLDNVKILLEKYNSIFGVDSSLWYQSNPSTDIYIKAEKNNNIIKSFQMFYEKDTSTLKVNKKMKYHQSDTSSSEEFYNIKPEGVVSKYNELKAIYSDNSPEKYNEKKNSGKSVPKKNYSDNRGSGNNDSYSSNHDNNEPDHQDLNRSGTMRDRSGRAIGKIDRDGTIRDDCNREIGRFESDGIIRDECNREIGRIESDGVFRDECNRELGRIESDGIVRDECNRELGRIDDDGVVRDANNNEIGRADSISNEQAAYMYFFHNN